MDSSDLTQTVISHLGGENILTRIGARGFFTQGARVSFQLNRANPKKVHSVVISTEPHGYFRMDCYGEVVPGTLTAPLVGSAHAIIPENLATVLGQLTGIESIHHRHFWSRLFVDSTVKASGLGDRAWRRILDEHDQTACNIVAQYRGRLVKTTGDSIVGTFDGPGRAIRCALALSASSARMGLQLRAGLHTGEIEIRGDDIAGIGVNAAARVMAQCAPGEVLVRG